MVVVKRQIRNTAQNIMHIKQLPKKRNPHKQLIKKRVLQKQSTKKRVSVIVPIYNVEDYISECLESLCLQTYGIENLEIIVVNDQTPDDSMAVVDKFKDVMGASLKIVYNSQKKEGVPGLGLARNVGVLEATGNYLLFLDSDDFLEKNAIEELVSNIEEYDVDMVLFSDHRFGDTKTFPSNPSSCIFKDSQKLYRHEYMRYPELMHHVSACFRLFSMRFFKEYFKGFPEGLYYEDINLMLEMLAKSKSVYINHEVKYQYRIRESSIMTSSWSDKHLEDHTLVVEQIDVLKKQHPDLKFGLNWLIIRTYHTFLCSLFRSKTPEKYEEIYKRIKKVYDDIDDTNIYSQHIGKAHIQRMSDIKNSNSLREAQYLRKSQRGYRRYFNKNLSFIKSKKILSYKETLKAKKYIRYLQTLENVELQKQNICLIGERVSEAKDNGFDFFRYMRETYPDFPIYYVIREDSSDFAKVNAYGNVVLYGSKEHEEKFANAKILLCTHSRSNIEPWPHKWHNKVVKRYSKYWEKKYIFLQHGVIMSDFSKSLGASNKINGNFSLFVCGAKPEHQFITQYYGYQPNQVVYTGLPRFDSLCEYTVSSKEPKKILFIPTWRTSIANFSWRDERFRKDDIFLKSNYFKTLTSFLHNQELNEFLEEYQAEIIFYPHPEIQQYADYFSSATMPKNIKLVDFKNTSVYDLIRSCVALITDFSSVFFDFAYQNKAILHYHFDYDEYMKEHYKPGYFKFNKDALGPSFSKEDELIEGIRKMILSGFKMEDIYRIRSDRFFPNKDQNNSRRIYEEICKLLEKS